MTAPTTNFLGIPVEGDITKPDRRTPQRPLAELEPLIQAVLADDTIDSFGWTQYTPYFNDGEPCTFSVGEPWFRTTADAKPAQDPDSDDYDPDEDEDEDDSYSVGYGNHPTLGKRDYDYVGSRGRERVYRGYEGPDEARHDRCLALHTAIDSGAYDDVLLEAFGDHARITIRKDKIVVDEYSHD